MNGFLSKSGASSLYCKIKLDYIFSKLLGGSGAVLMLHRIRDAGQSGFAPNRNLSISPEFLDDMLTDLRQRGFEFVSMDELAADLSDGTGRSERRKLALTLDDGYQDNFVNAVPIFRKHDVPYTIYVVPGYIDGTIPHWTDEIETIVAQSDRIELSRDNNKEFVASTNVAEKYQVYSRLAAELLAENNLVVRSRMLRDLAEAHGFNQEAHHRRLTMTWDQIRDLSLDPLCTIGAHSMTHRMLSKLNARDALWELSESRRVIADQLGTAPGHFAYPYGEANQREFKLATEAGYQTAVTTVNGVIGSKHCARLTALPRIMIDGRHQTMDVVNTQLSGIPGRVLSLVRKIRRDLKRAQYRPQEVTR